MKNGGDRGQSNNESSAYVSFFELECAPVLGRKRCVKIHVSANMVRITKPVDESDRLQVADTRSSCFILSFINRVSSRRKEGTLSLEGRERGSNDGSMTRET